MFFFRFINGGDLMSRSYKKTPIIQDKYGAKTNKWSARQASKAVRRYKGYIANGGAYKKIYCSWLINDYTIYQEWNLFAKRRFKSKREWSKHFYNK